MSLNLNEIFASLSDKVPQWGPLIGMLEFRESKDAAPVDNDGRTIYYNTQKMQYYTLSTQMFYFAQQLMHVQLAHAQRGEGRDPALWKRATDDIVNEMLVADGFQQAEDLRRRPEAAGVCAEDLYVRYARAAEDGEDAEEAPPEMEEPTKKKTDVTGKHAGNDHGAKEREIEEPGLAKAVAGLADLLEPSMQIDFDWFPGDTIRDGMLRERFRPYPVPHAEILLDTSASIDAELLRTFVRGVKGLLAEDAVVRVGCFDTKFYGWQDVRTEQDIQNLELKGAGGTDFETAIHAFTGDAETRIIFTDGYAEMPPDRCDAIWLVYSSTPIHPVGGRVIYVEKPEETEHDEIDFLIT